MNNGKWSIPFEKPEVSSELLNSEFNPLLTRVLAWKNFISYDESHRFINASADSLSDPFLMKDMKEAVERIQEAIVKHEKTVVYGDYDVDGITASCLLTDYLLSKGVDCSCHIPHREDEGYGLNKKAIDEFHINGISLIITVDCGITAVEESEYAKSLGIDVIITDHHECPEGKLPDAVAVVDYKRPDDLYPSKFLAGVGVAFKLVTAVEHNAALIVDKYSDLVAIGTVADVMPLLGENRYLVQTGLNKINSAPRPGIAAMMAESVSGKKTLNASGISFTIAPRLNAAGRLNKVNIAEKLLISNDLNEATALARELNELNRQRQSIENEIWAEASHMIHGNPDGPIVLAKEGWNQGVIGIAASRLTEKYGVPAIIICMNSESGNGKGSCRAPKSFNLHEALKACSNHLESFGGHALAAGLNIRNDNIDRFRQALRQYYFDNKTSDDEPEVNCDILIDDASLLSVENVRSLDLLEPFGPENPKPLMCMYGVTAGGVSSVGADKKHTKLKVTLDNNVFDCIFFSHTLDDLRISDGDLIDIAFIPQINEFHGRTSVQLSLSAARQHCSKELCERILASDESVFWSLSTSSMFPDENERRLSWRAVCNRTVGSSFSEILSQKPDTVSIEKFCISLVAFLQAGWISPISPKTVYGARKSDPFDPKPLPDSSIISFIRKCFNERNSYYGKQSH